MNRELLALSATLICLSGAAEPAQAEGIVGNDPRYAPRHSRLRAYRPHARMLPPEIRYRDPRVGAHPHRRPDFLIQAYLPRPSNLPMYNEPPRRFPER